MKIYIMTDLEGASGLFQPSQTMPDEGADYEYGKRCLTRDVNNVAAAAFDHGATEIVVCDGHGPGGLNWDQVDPRVALERCCGPREHVFLSLDDSFDCAFVIGQHAMAGTQHAFLEHTQSSREYFELKINGDPHGEMSQFAACAGHFGLPLALLTGDRAACAEANRLFPSAVTAEVKYAHQRVRCACYPAARVEQLLREKTAEAMDAFRAGKMQPWILEKPIRMELTFQRVESADQFVRGGRDWKRIGSRTFLRETDRQNTLYST